MRLKPLYMVWCLAAILVGCASVPPKPSKPTRPEWTMRAPGEANGIMSFVGVSTFASTEQKSRKNAFEEATNQVVKYLGTEAKGKVEKIASSFGLASETIDETVGERSFQEQLFGGVTRRLKAKVWHDEIKYNAKGEIEYKYFVLAEIPTAELDEAIKEAAQKAAEENRKIEEAAYNAEAMLAKRIEVATVSAKQGNLLGALEQLQELQTIAQKQPTPKRDSFITDAKGLETQWLGSVHLVAQSGNDQMLEPGQTPGSLKVQVVMQSGSDSLPVRNFPVVFLSKCTQDVPLMTDPNGFATLPLPPFKSSGVCSFVVIPYPDRIRDQFPEAIAKDLLSRKAFFKIEIKVPFLKQRIKNDFPLMLASSVKGNLRVGETSEVVGSCAKRCRIRLYYWDGQTGTLVHETQGPKLTKGEVRSLAEGVSSDAPGRFTLIALATTGAYPDAVDAGTAYAATEFAVVLKNFRNMKGTKAEEHLEITVQE